RGSNVTLDENARGRPREQAASHQRSHNGGQRAKPIAPSGYCHSREFDPFPDSTRASRADGVSVFSSRTSRRLFSSPTPARVYASQLCSRGWGDVWVAATLFLQRGSRTTIISV